MTMLEHALSCAKRGWKVFPLSPETKIPFKESHGFKDATNKPEEIKKIWTKQPDANIGIATGHASGIFVLDVDDKKSPSGKISEGSRSLKILEDLHGDLPSTIQLLTPSKSKQLWFQMPKDEHISISAEKLGNGLDIRANGGYTLAPPSYVAETPTYPYSGQYEWFSDQGPDDMPLAPCPQWLIDLLIEEEPDFSLFSGKNKSELNINCVEILNKYNVKDLKSSRDGKIIFGSHPVHGSSNGQNFFIDVEKGLWHCFRHNVGGNALTLIAILEGTLDCFQCTKGALRGKKYKEIIGIAVKYFNFDPKIVQKDDSGIIWDRNGDCSLKPTFNNCMNFLEGNECFKNIYYNTACQSVFINNDYLDDIHLLSLKEVFRKKNFEPTINTINEAVSAFALKNKKNPITQYLDSIKWDGINRIDTWLTDYCGAEDNEYTRKVAKMTLVAGIYRAYKPGTKYDYMLLLEGDQGIKKSTLIEELSSPQFFSEANLLDKGKDIIQQIKGAWFVEVAELAAFSKTDINSLKAFIVRKVDEQRFAYNRHISRIKRSFILIGSINPESVGYLRDKTGNRRFLPVKVHNLNIEGIKKVRDQLFAEAIEAYRNDYQIYFTDSERHILDMAKNEQKSREQHDEWDDIIYQWIFNKRIDIGDFVSCSQIWEDCFEKELGDLKNSDSRRIGDCLLSLGAVKPDKPMRVGGILGRFFDITPIKNEIRTYENSESERITKVEWDS